MVYCVAKKAIENVSAMVTSRDPFLDFIDADDTVGTGLTNGPLKKLEDTGTAVADMRGQNYNIGANIKERKRRIRTQI